MVKAEDSMIESFLEISNDCSPLEDSFQFGLFLSDAGSMISDFLNSAR